MPPQPTHIVDTGAVIAYFKGENGQDRFAELLLAPANVLAMHAMNFCELYYLYLRADGHDRAGEAWANANEAVAIVDLLSEQFIKRIGRWKAGYGLGLGDAVAAATAEEYGCPLVTTDHNDFGDIDAAGALEILWLR